MLEDPLHGLSRIPSLGHDLKVGLVLQQTPQPLPQKNMIVH
jgi:hypothetical protein